MRERMNNCGCGPMLLAAAMVVLVMACGIKEVGTPDLDLEMEQEGIESSIRPVCCVSGFVYPSGYDWYEDPTSKEVRCSLVVFADGVPKIKVPVGDGYEVSRDPEMYRVIDGNLYTFYSKEGKTVFRRNGAPLFRYDADEVLVDMEVRGEDIYSLSHKRSGEGFSYRKNGKVLLERFSGETFGKFWHEGDSLCFAFMQPVALDMGVENRYYVSFESQTVLVQNPNKLDRVWDIMSHNGTPCQLISLLGLQDVMLMVDGSQLRIKIPNGAKMLSCRLFPADNLIGVECLYEYPDGKRESGIWVEASEYIRFETGSSIQALRYTAGNAYCLLTPEQGEGMIFDAGEIIRMPQEYFCVGPRSLDVHEGELYVAMSSRTGGWPLVWHNHQTDTLRVNGCVSSISFTGKGK